METPFCTNPLVATTVTEPIVSLAILHDRFLGGHGPEEPCDDGRPAKSAWEQQGEQGLTSPRSRSTAHPGANSDQPSVEQCGTVTSREVKIGAISKLFRGEKESLGQWKHAELYSSP